MIRPKIIVLVCLLIGSSVLIGGKEWLSNSEASDADHAGFFYDLLWRLNDDREMLGWLPLVRDVRLQEWTRLQLIKAAENSRISPDQILHDLKKEIPSIATASIFVAYAGTRGDMQERIAEWAIDVDKEQTYLAASIFSDSDGEGVGGLVMIVRRLPRFHPSLLGKGNTKAFYNICPICNESHHGKVLSGARSVVLECPECKRSYDLLALDLRGAYHRVTDFFIGEDPSAVPQAETCEKQDQLREIVAIWTALLNHCRYATDFQRISGQRDAWQFSDETDRYRSGDCEDTAILLADWLISRGFDARVALGRTRQLEGHAWCVVRHEGEQYILETTEAEPDLGNPPTVERVGQLYMPEFAFDREGIFFRNEGHWNGDYWSTDGWSGVGYANESANLKTAALQSE